MPSSSRSAKAARKKQVPMEEKCERTAKVYTFLEVDPALEDPELLQTIREKNKDALACALDPSRRYSKTSQSNTMETVWHLIGVSHHLTGNLDLLTDLTPVSDRWIRSVLGLGPPSQVLARGSVNSNGIILDDVWFVPDCNANLVSSAQLGVICRMDTDECSLIRPDDNKVVGECHLGTDGLYEVNYINTSSEAVWYIASNVSQHMKGNLHLFSDFCPIRPCYTVQTHNGAKLQVCGKGSVSTGKFSIPNVSYVPGLSENILSISQLTDTGFTVAFGADGFAIRKRSDGKLVGSGSYGGNQLFHLDSLTIPITK